MPSPTSRLRLLKQAPGSNFDAWGSQLNVGALDLVDEAFGVSDIAVAANVTLTIQNYVSDEARRLVLHLTGAGGFTITAPAVDKVYLVVNDCADAVTLTPSGGTGASIPANTFAWWWCDGTDGHALVPAFDADRKALGALDLDSNKITGLADPTAAQDGATKAYVDGRRLDQAAAPTGAVSLNSQKITSLADGTNAGDAVNRSQLDAIAGSAAAAAQSAQDAQDTLDELDNRITVSTDAPSGGNDGDIWFRIA